MRRRRVYVAAAGLFTVLLITLVGARYIHPLWFAAVGLHRPPKSLVMPVEGVHRSGLRSTWHAPRSGGRKHKGADIFAPKGTAVRSSTRGIVWKVGDDRLGGRVVSVLGEGPAIYYYAHLDDWAPGLERGQRVEPGQLLGYVGNTGNARTTPPHLHFGVYRLGFTHVRAVDPVPLLVRTSNPFGD